MTEWEGRAQKQERHTDIGTLLCLISFDSKGDRGVTSNLKGKDLTKQHDTESHTEFHPTPLYQLGGERILERSHALPASHWHAHADTQRQDTDALTHSWSTPLPRAHTHQASVTENKFLQLPGSCAQAHHARCAAVPGLGRRLLQGPSARHSSGPGSVTHQSSGREKDVVPATSHSQGCPASYPACWLGPHPTPTPSSTA